VVLVGSVASNIVGRGFVSGLLLYGWWVWRAFSRTAAVLSGPAVAAATVSARQQVVLTRGREKRERETGMGGEKST